jgi:hypothetical protein
MKVPLKLHQKRTLKHMIDMENYKYRIADENILILSDNVGSGKSYCILSLIGAKPKVNLAKNIYHTKSNNINSNPNVMYCDYTPLLQPKGFMLSPNCIEFNSNLIIVPHGIFGQWQKYIINHTNLSYISIANHLDITKLKQDKESIIEKLNSVSIILIKASIYTSFIDYLKSYGLEQETMPYKMNVKYSEDEDEKCYIEHINFNETICNKVILKTNVIDTRQFLDIFNDKYEEFLHSTMTTNLEENFTKYKDEINKMHNQYINNPNTLNTNLSYCKDVIVTTGYIFQRIIIDEADSIKIPSCPRYIKAKMTWLITSSFISLLFPNGDDHINEDNNMRVSNGINGCMALKLEMRDLTHKSNGVNKISKLLSLVIRNHPDFVKQSMDIPSPIINRIRCYTGFALNAISQSIDKNIMRALNAGDINTVSDILGYEINTEEDIINSVSGSLQKKLNMIISENNTKRLELARLNTEANEAENRYNEIKEEYKNVVIENRPIQYDEIKKVFYNIKQRVYYTEKTIDSNNGIIKEYECKIKNITDRFTDPTAKTCPICMDNIKIGTLVTCCKNIFCLECIKESINKKTNCPLCRDKLDKTKIKIINTELECKVDKKDEKVLYDKIDVLCDFILNNENRRILIFSEYEMTFQLIENRMRQLGIQYGRIMGTTYQINKTIENFKNAKVNILMLNAQYFGAGINLQMTDDIFIYHRMSSDLEKQVVGRAQRIGRTDKLNIHYLCYDNEYLEDELTT